LEEVISTTIGESRRPSQLFLRLRNQLPEHLDGRNTGRVKRILCGIPPNRRSVERSDVRIVFAAAIHHKNVLVENPAGVLRLIGGCADSSQGLYS
jgi:hypothetical protein